MNVRSRRTVLKIFTLGAISFFVIIWNKLTLSHMKVLKAEKSLILFNKNKSITFFDDFIIVNQSDSITVLSSHCKHLGCKINKIENNRMVCPCHGSEFDLSGKVLKGPAYKNLDNVPFKISTDGTQLEIEG